MPFKIELKQDIPEKTKLTFVVQKKDDKGHTTGGNPFTYEVSYLPEITVEFGGDPTGAAFWNAGSSRTGVIKGSSLAAGVPITDRTDLMTIERVDKGSDEKTLNFTMTIAQKKVASNTPISFWVTNAAGQPITQKRPYKIPEAK